MCCVHTNDCMSMCTCVDVWRVEVFVWCLLLEFSIIFFDTRCLGKSGSITKIHKKARLSHKLDWSLPASALQHLSHRCTQLLSFHFLCGCGSYVPVRLALLSTGPSFCPHDSEYEETLKSISNFREYISFLHF